MVDEVRDNLWEVERKVRDSGDGEEVLMAEVDDLDVDSTVPEM